MTEENGKSEPRYCAYMLAIIGFLRNYTQNTLILHLSFYIHWPTVCFH